MFLVGLCMNWRVGSIQFGKLTIPSTKKWQEIEMTMQCWMTNGAWKIDTDKAESHLYEYPCTDLRYVHGICEPGGNYSRKSKFHWEVPQNSCDVEYSRVDQLKFAKLLSGERIMFIGDSITEEFYISFVSSFISQKNCLVCGHYCNGTEVQTVNTGSYSFQTTSTRNDRFSFEESVDMTRMFIEVNFYESFVRNNITLVVMNRGAHYQETDVVVAEMNRTLHHLFSHHSHLAVVYRNTPPGSPHFGELYLNEPLTSPPPNDQGWNTQKGSDSTQPFHWNKFHAQNVDVEAFLKDKFPMVLRLDAYTPTVLRADSHVDGLHYCIPGPIDEWVTILYNALSLVASSSVEVGELP